VAAAFVILAAATLTAGTTPAQAEQPRPAASGDVRLRLGWSRVVGRDHETQGAAVAAHPDGGPVVVAVTSNPTLATNEVYDRTFRGVEDLWIAHYTQQGRLLWATYVGGFGADRPESISVGPAGIDVTGITYSSDFADPSTPAGLLPEARAFAIRLTLNGKALAWKWISPTSSVIDAHKIVQLPNGDDVLSGLTSGDLPIATNAADSVRVGTEGWVARLHAGTLQWVTYLGGTGYDDVRSLALRPDGAIAVAGQTTSTDFPVTAGAFDTSRMATADSEGFVGVLSSDGTHLNWASFLGDRTGVAAGSVLPLGIAADTANGVVVVGETERADLPVHATAWSAIYEPGTHEAFIAHFTADGASVDRATYLPGLRGPALQQCVNGRLLIAGTATAFFPTTDRTAPQGDRDVGVLIIDQDLNKVAASTMFGGAQWDAPNDVALLREGAALTGITMSPDFPDNDSRASGNFQGFLARITMDPAARSCSAPA
jgi:hypothetical protein